MLRPITVSVIGLAMLTAGCSNHPPAPAAPEISPQEAGQRAISQYDQDGDGKLNREEYSASPALQAAVERIDADADGMLTAEEITARIEYWLGSGTTIMSGNTQIFRGGVPLAGAEVVYEPEPFLGPSFKPSTGETGPTGVARMQGQDAEFPGVYLGLYRVKVSKVVNGSETIPAKYNTKTTLGCEISDDIYHENGMLRFDL